MHKSIMKVVYIAEYCADHISLSQVAEKQCISTRTLQRRFQKAVGINFIEYLQKIRLNNACQMIELTPQSIAEISFLVGYMNVSAFRKIFYREFGLSPVEYRKRFSIS